jgi:acetolactate synthase-1/2/3 large subunit
MLGMHGTYEANMAMHDCDVMINASARVSMTASPGGSMQVLARTPRRSISISIRPRSTRCPCRYRHSSAMSPMCSRTWCAVARSSAKTDASAQADWWRQIDKWKGAQLAGLSAQQGRDHAAIRDPAALRADQEPGKETYITTEVGQHQMWAAQFFGFEEPNRWMTSGGWARWATACRRRSAFRSRIRDALVIDIAGDASC